MAKLTYLTTKYHSKDSAIQNFGSYFKRQKPKFFLGALKGHF